MSIDISKLDRMFSEMRHIANKTLSGKKDSLQELTEDDISRLARTRIPYAPYQKCFTKDSRNFLILAVDEESGCLDAYTIEVNKVFHWGPLKIRIPPLFYGA